MQQGRGLRRVPGVQTDAGQQPQGHSVVRIPQEIGPDDLAGGVQVPVRQQTAGHHHLDRELPQYSQMLRRRRRAGRISPKPIELFQKVPGGGLRGAEPDRRLEGRNRARRLVELHKALAPLLVQATERRLQSLQSGQDRKSLRRTVLGAQVPCLMQQGLPVIEGAEGAHAPLPLARNGASQGGSGWSAS